MKILHNRTILITTLFIFISVLTVLIYFINEQDNFSLVHPLTKVAELSLSPNQMSLSSNQVFTVAIKLNTHDEEINTVTANLSYPADLLELLELDTQNSFATIWFEKETTIPGSVKITGSLPTPGFKGQATFALLEFKTKKQGEARVNFTTSAAVFRDRDSLNILGQTAEGVYLIQ